MKLTAALANELFRAFYIERWNDRIRPMFMAEMDKHAHKLIIAYCIGKYEEIQGHTVDWGVIFRDAIYELLRRVAISDIKSPIYQEIKNNKEVFRKLNEFVFNKLGRIITDSALSSDFHAFLFADNPRNTLEHRIADAAHIYASFWEFTLVKVFNPFQHQNAKVELEIRHRLGGYSDMRGVDNLLNNHSITNFIDLCGQLRFQIRWAQTPRLPRTSVLGHTMLVAAISYFLSLEMDVCSKRLYNNFFGGLFHDLPEVVTRDIISPVKRSSDKLDNLVSELEKQLADKEIFPYLEENWVEEMKYWTQNEFHNKIIIDNQIQLGLTTAELNSKYNADIYSPFDGKVIKFADQYSAYLEASKSIEAGVSSTDLIAAKEHIIRNFARTEFGNLKMTHLFGDALVVSDGFPL